MQKSYKQFTAYQFSNYIIIPQLIEPICSCSPTQLGSWLPSGSSCPHLTAVSFLYGLSLLLASVAALSLLAIVVSVADRLAQRRRRLKRSARLDLEDAASNEVVATAAAAALVSRDRRKRLTGSWQSRRRRSARRKVESSCGEVDKAPRLCIPVQLASSSTSTMDRVASTRCPSSSDRASPHVHLVLPPPPVYATVDKGVRAPPPPSSAAAIYARRVAARHFRSSKGGRMSRISCDVVWAEEEGETVGGTGGEGGGEVMVSSYSSASTVSTVKRRQPKQRDVVPDYYATVEGLEEEEEDAEEEEEEDEHSEEYSSLRSGDYQYLAEAPFSCQTSIVPLTRNQFYLVVQINVNPQQQQQQQQQQRRKRKQQQQQQQNGLPVVEEAERGVDNVDENDDDAREEATIVGGEENEVPISGC